MSLIITTDLLCLGSRPLNIFLYFTVNKKRIFKMFIAIKLRCLKANVYRLLLGGKVLLTSTLN